MPRGAHLADQEGLPSVEGGAVRRQFQQSQIHGRLVDRLRRRASGGGDQALLGVEDPLRCVQVGTGDGVDRRPVDPPQRLRFLDVVSRCGEGNRPAIQHLIDQQIHQRSRTLDRHIGRTDLPLGLGADMPHLPGGAAFLHHGQDVISRLCDPGASAIVAVPSGRGERGLHYRRDGIAPT